MQRPSPLLRLLKKQTALALRVFLVGDGAACAKSGQSVPRGNYRVEKMLRALTMGGAPVEACRTCMDARGLRDKELARGSRRSRWDEETDWVLWAGPVLVFGGPDRPASGRTDARSDGA